MASPMKGEQLQNLFSHSSNPAMTHGHSLSLPASLNASQLETSYHHLNRYKAYMFGHSDPNLSPYHSIRHLREETGSSPSHHSKSRSRVQSPRRRLFMTDHTLKTDYALSRGLLSPGNHSCSGEYIHTDPYSDASSQSKTPALQPKISTTSPTLKTRNLHLPLPSMTYDFRSMDNPKVLASTPKEDTRDISIAHVLSAPKLVAAETEKMRSTSESPNHIISSTCHQSSHVPASILKKFDVRRWSVASLPSSGYGTNTPLSSSSQHSSNEKLMPQTHRTTSIIGRNNAQRQILHRPKPLHPTGGGLKTTPMALERSEGLPKLVGYIESTGKISLGHSSRSTSFKPLPIPPHLLQEEENVASSASPVGVLPSVKMDDKEKENTLSASNKSITCGHKGDSANVPPKSSNPCLPLPSLDSPSGSSSVSMRSPPLFNRSRSHSLRNSAISLRTSVCENEIYMMNQLYKERFPKAIQKMEEALMTFIEANRSEISYGCVLAKSNPNQQHQYSASTPASPLSRNSFALSPVPSSSSNQTPLPYVHHKSSTSSDALTGFVRRQYVELAQDCLDKSRAGLVSSAYFFELSEKVEHLLAETRAKLRCSNTAGDQRGSNDDEASELCPAAVECNKLARELLLAISRPARLLECLEFDPVRFYDLLTLAESELLGRVRAARARDKKAIETASVSSNAEETEGEEELTQAQNEPDQGFTLRDPRDIPRYIVEKLGLRQDSPSLTGGSGSSSPRVQRRPSSNRLANFGGNPTALNPLNNSLPAVAGVPIKSNQQPHLDWTSSNASSFDSRDESALLSTSSKDSSFDVSLLPTVPIIPREEDFEIVKLVSKGAYASVYLSRHRETQKRFAIKKICKKNLIMRNQLLEQVFTERDILSFIDNPFVVTMYGSYETKTHLCMILEYVEGGDCASLLKNLVRLPVDLARLYFAETVLALEYLHHFGIVHRDLKPENLLITCTGHIKLTDFGLSKIGLMSLTTNYCEGYTLDWREAKHFSDMTVFGTPEYIAPEVILRQGYGKPVDWWSMGIILYEFLVGCVPFYGETPEDLFDNILKNDIEWPPPEPPTTAEGEKEGEQIQDEEEGESVIAPEAKNLITLLLNPDPLERLGTLGGAEEVKNHAFFQAQIDWNGLIRRKAEFVPRLEDDEDTSYFDTRCNRYNHSDDDEMSEPDLYFSPVQSLKDHSSYQEEERTSQHISDSSGQSSVITSLFPNLNLDDPYSTLMPANKGAGSSKRVSTPLDVDLNVHISSSGDYYPSIQDDARGLSASHSSLPSNFVVPFMRESRKESGLTRSSPNKASPLLYLPEFASSSPSYARLVGSNTTYRTHRSFSEYGRLSDEQSSDPSYKLHPSLPVTTSHQELRSSVVPSGESQKYVSKHPLITLTARESISPEKYRSAPPSPHPPGGNILSATPPPRILVDGKRLPDDESAGQVLSFDMSPACDHKATSPLNAAFPFPSNKVDSPKKVTRKESFARSLGTGPRLPSPLASEIPILNAQLHAKRGAPVQNDKEILAGTPNNHYKLTTSASAFKPLTTANATTMTGSYTTGGQHHLSRSVSVSHGNAGVFRQVSQCYYPRSGQTGSSGEDGKKHKITSTLSQAILRGYSSPPSHYHGPPNLGGAAGGPPAGANLLSPLVLQELPLKALTKQQQQHRHNTTSIGFNNKFVYPPQQQTSKRSTAQVLVKGSGAKTESLTLYRPQPLPAPHISVLKPPVLVRKRNGGFGFTLQSVKVYGNCGEPGRAQDSESFTMQHLVSKIIPKGPAFESGLREKDLIVKINGQPVHGLLHTQVVRMIFSSGPTLNLAVASLSQTSIASSRTVRSHKQNNSNKGSGKGGLDRHSSFCSSRGGIIINERRAKNKSLQQQRYALPPLSPTASHHLSAGCYPSTHKDGKHGSVCAESPHATKTLLSMDKTQLAQRRRSAAFHNASPFANTRRLSLNVATSPNCDNTTTDSTHNEPSK